MVGVLQEIAKVVGLLVLLALAALGVLDLALAQEPVRAWCVRQVEAKLQRKVQVAALSAGPLRGISVEGLAVSRGKDFEQGALLEAAAARFSWSWPALIQGRYELSEIVLAGPRVKLLSPLQDALPAALALLPPVKVASLRVRGGRLSWPGPSGEVELTDIAAVLSGFAPNASAGLTAAFRCQAAGTTPPPTRGSLEARLSLDGIYRVGASSGSATLLRPTLGPSSFERARLEWSLTQSAAAPGLARGRARFSAENGVLGLPAVLPSTATWAGAFWAPLAALSRPGKTDLRRPRPLASFRGSYAFASGKGRAALVLKGPGLAVDTRPAARPAAPAPGAAPTPEELEAEAALADPFADLDREPPPKPADPASLDELLAP